MAKERVVIKEVPADVQREIGDKLGEILTSTPPQAEGEGFEPHINTGAAPHLGPRRPSKLPPKAYEKPYRTFDDIN